MYESNFRIIFFLCGFFTLLFSHDLSAFIYPYETPIVKYLKPTEVLEFDSGLDLIDCIYVINLDERPEKWNRVKPLFDERGLKVNRFSAINGYRLSKAEQQELSGPYPIGLYMTAGVYGCLLSHISVIKDAYERGFDLIWVCEDDVEFLEDVKQIPEFLRKLSEIDPDWDIFYTDVDPRNEHGHIPATWLDPRPDQKLFSLKEYQERILINRDIMKIRYRLAMHSMLYSRKGMKKVLDYFTHVYVWSPIDLDIHYISGIREYSTTKDIVSNWIDSPSDTGGINRNGIVPLIIKKGKEKNHKNKHKNQRKGKKK